MDRLTSLFGCLVGMLLSFILVCLWECFISLEQCGIGRGES